MADEYEAYQDEAKGPSTNGGSPYEGSGTPRARKTEAAVELKELELAKPQVRDALAPVDLGLRTAHMRLAEEILCVPRPLTAENLDLLREAITHNLEFQKKVLRGARGE